MPNKNYLSGYRAEAKEVEYWKLLGYWASRTPGSKGACDVFATNGEEVVFVQVKRFKKVRPTYRDARKYLKTLPSGPIVRKLLAVYGPEIQGRPTRRVEYTLN